MNKFVRFSILVVALIALVTIGIGGYVINTPEYALKEIIRDVNDNGMEGLYPHLTDDAKKKINVVSAALRNDTVTSVIGLINKNNSISVLKSQIQVMQWSISDVLKGKDNASIFLSFNYKDKLSGTIELLMIREDGKWKIDRLAFP